MPAPKMTHFGLAEIGMLSDFARKYGVPGRDDNERSMIRGTIALWENSSGDVRRWEDGVRVPTPQARRILAVLRTLRAAIKIRVHNYGGVPAKVAPLRATIDELIDALDFCVKYSAKYSD